MANRKITYEVGFTGDTSQLQAALKRAVASLQELGTNPQNLQRGLEGAAHAALELNNHLRNAYNADTGKLDLTRFRQELDKGGKSLEDYAKELKRLGPEGEQAFMQVATAIGAAELPLKRSNQLLNQLWITMKNTARWRLTTGALNAFIGGLQQAFGYSKSLNASLNDIRIVTGKSADEMARFAKEANQAAKELSTTTTTYTDASLIYYQQGLDDQAVKERTDTTIKMANVTGQSAETISSQMTAVWNNFREGSRTLESYADTMVALGASTASSSKEIAEGLEKFAPIADSVGLSFDYASAALATLVATTRESASVAGNALKTLFSRLEGLKLGETLDDGTDLNKYSQALYTVGINIKDTNGELKDMDVILTELGNRWKDLARDEQMALAQTVGGVRQYAQLVALMDNWQVFQQNLTTARTAEGSLEKQAQIYAESWEAARDRVKAATEDVYDSLINPKVFIDLDKMAQAVLKPLASVLDAVGGLTGLLPIVAALMTKVYSSQIAGVIRDMAINIGLMTGKEQERVRILQSTAAKLTEGLFSTYDDKSSASAKLSILRDYVSLQGELNTKADQYNEFQMEQIKNGLAMVEVYKNQALASQDILEKTQGVFDETQDKFDSFIKETAQLGKINIEFGSESKYQKIIKDLTLINTNYVDLANSIKNEDTKQFLNIVNDGIDQMAKKSVKLDTLKNILGETDQETASWKKNVIDLANELGLLGEGIQLDEEALEAFRNNPEIFEELREKVSDSGEASVEVQQNFQALFELLKLGTENAEGLQTVFYSLIRRTKELAKDGYDAETSLKALTETIERLKNYKPQQEPIDLANSFVAIANGASRAAMAVRSVTNIVETFSDTTISASEKLTRSLTSLAMILPVITNTIRGIAAGGAAAIGGWATIAVAVIVGLVKVLDTLIVTQKEAAQSIQESINKYKEAEQELQNLQSELETTQDRIKELQDLAASGSISIVEQEELKNLEIENDKLERQIKLREKLAEQKLKDAVKEIRNNSDKAYSFTSEGYFDVSNALLQASRTGAIDPGDYSRILGIVEQSAIANLSKEEMLHKIETQVIPDSKSDLSIEAQIEQFKKDAEFLYDVISETREEYHEKWKAENYNTYEQLESDYLTYLEGYKKGYVTERELANQQIKLYEARKKIYDKEGEYVESFLDPVLAQLSNQDFDILYNTIGPVYRDYLSESGQDLLTLYGISPYELQEQILAIKDKAFSELAKFGFKDLTDKLGYQELNLIAKFEFQEDSEFTEIQQLFNFLRENAGIVPISLQVQTIEDARTEALTALASGELLSDEMITKLQEVYAGIKDIANFNELSVEDQIEFLTSEGKVAEKTIKDLTDRYNELNKQLNDIKNSGLGKKLEDNPIYVATKLEVDEVEKELEKLKQDFERDPWKIRIELGNEIGARINNVKKALALINEDLTVNAENLVELAKRYPEALVEATYDENSNLLKLDEERYNNLQTLLNETLDATRDTNAQALLDAANTAFGILNIVKDTEDGKRDQSNITLDNILSNNQEQIDDIKRISLQALIQVAKSEKEKRQQQLDTMIQQVSGAKSAADTMAKNAEITAQNYSAAADTILKAFDTAFRNIATGSAALASGQYTSIWSQGWNQSSAKYEKGVSDLSVYQKNIADVKSSPEYKTLEAEIKLIDPLIDALQNYYETGEDYDKISEALKGFSELPDEIAGVLSNLNLNIGDISTGAASIFGDGFVDALVTGFADDNAIRTAFETMLDDPRTAEALAGAAQNVYDDLITALSNLLESPETDKTKGGSGGKSDLVKLDKADLDAEEQALEEIEDRYHEITREIERQERVLTKLEHQIDRTYGLDRLKLYEQEIKDLNKLQDDQRTKSARAERYLKDVDTDRLINAFQATGYSDNLSGRLSARGIGFAGSSSYDIENAIKSIGKEITNFEEVERYINQDMNNFMSAYTDFMKQYDGFVQKYEAMTDEEKLLIQAEAEQWKLDYELLQDQFKLVEAQQEERLAAIEQYESTLDTINTLAHEIEDTQRRIEDTKLNEITYRMDVILDVRDARKQIRDFSKEIAESFGDALTHGLQTASLGWDQAKDEMAMYKEYVQEYNDLKSLLDNATEYTDTEAIVAELKELEGNIIESGQRLLEWSEQVENMFVEALSAAADRFSYFTNQLEHNDTILATMKELYALQGQTYKTQQGFNRLQRVAQERLETQVGQAKLQRKWFEEADAKLQEAQAQLDALIAEKGAEAEQDFHYDTFKKNRDALLKEQQEAQKAMLSAAQEAMETAQQMYLDQIEKAVYEFGQALSGGFSLDLLQEKYDHYIEEEERYLDKVNEAYQVTAWYDKLQKDIDNTSNKLTKDRLKALQEEIDIRREGNTLSQYDLDILEAKYKVTQAQMALEDAQNNKSQLRLVRDRSGNWNYQFTLNEDDIADKEKDLINAENEWYNIAKQQTKETTGEIIATWQECQEKLSEIYSDISNFVMNEETGRLELTKEANQQAIDLYEFYVKKIQYLRKEQQIATDDMTEAGNQSMIHMALAAGEEVADITGITGEDVEDIIKITGQSVQDLLQMDLSQINAILIKGMEQTESELQSHSDIIRDIVGNNTSLINLFDNTYAEILTDMTKGTSDFNIALDEYIAEMQNRFKDYGDTVAQVSDDCGVSLNELDDQINNVSDSTDKMTYAGFAAADSLWRQLEATWDAQQGYLDLAAAVWEYIYALQALAAEQVVSTIESASNVDTFNEVDEYDSATDWSLKMGEAAKAGNWEAVDTYGEYRERKFDEGEFDRSKAVSTEDLIDAFKEAYGETTGKKDDEMISLLEEVLTGDKYYRDVIPIPSAATGMYTGDFDNGRLAILHEKELVLNQEDTKNILNAVQMVRTMQDNLFSNLANQLNSDGLAVMALLGQKIGGIGLPTPASSDLEQHVIIEQVSFPGVTSSREIEEAFENLVNDAAQWARRTKS